MTDSLTLHIRLFASLRDAAGWSDRSVQAPGDATPLHLWQQLELAAVWPGDAGHGGGTGLPEGLRVAINQAFAAADTPLADGDELAFLPPISGG